MFKKMPEDMFARCDTELHDIIDPGFINFSSCLPLHGTREPVKFPGNW